MMMEKPSACAVAKPKMAAAEQPHQEQLPCPRCHSTNTKFCYYNNYNFSQPRHFCKSCRRYWTHGGTLRDIPIGGGSRKSAKRCRTSASCTPASSSGVVTPSSSTSSHEFLNSTPVFLPSSAAYGCVGGGAGGGFTSLLTGNHAPGVWSLGGGFGLGLGSGLVEDAGFGLGKGGWAFGDVGYGGSNNAIGGGGVVNGATWQFESGDNSGFAAAADCFGWPELAISTPGNGLK